MISILIVAMSSWMLGEDAGPGVLTVGEIFGDWLFLCWLPPCFPLYAKAFFLDEDLQSLGSAPILNDMRSSA